MTQEYRVIDAHVHLSERRDDALRPFAMKNGLRYNMDELLGTMGKYRTKRGLLLSPPLKSGGPLPNEGVLKLCEKSHGMLRPILTVEPSTRQVKAAIRLAENYRRDVKGFKIRLGYVEASAHSRVFSPLYDYAEAERLPVLFHTGDTAFSDGSLSEAHPLTLDRLANPREELRIVLCHFGNPWFDDAAELIYKHPNVYADISGLFTGGKYTREYESWLARRISEAIYYVGGAEKILFGTDYPVSKYADTLQLVRSLKIAQKDREKILWGNAERVFGL